VLLIAVLAGQGRLVVVDAWLTALFVAVFVIAVGSGVQYVWIWSRKARRERAAIRTPMLQCGSLVPRYREAGRRVRMSVST
jgi:hypothetical protein